MPANPATFVDLVQSGFGRILEQTAVRGGVIPSDPTLDPVQVLKDLRLPPELQKSVIPVLTAFGFEHDEWALNDPQGFEDPCPVNRFWRMPAQKSFLVHIPKWILVRNSVLDRMAVDYIRHFFEARAQVYLISSDERSRWLEGVDILKTAFEVKFETWRAESKINVILIPWSKFEEMQTEASKPAGVPPAKLQTYWNVVFKLGPPAKPAKIDLTPDEREQLVEIFVTQAKHAPQPLGFAGYFRELIIKDSNLPEEWKENRIAALVGIPKTDAGNLIDWALDTGKNKNDGRHSYTVLAEILDPLMAKAGPDDLKFIKGLVLQKPLLLDQAARDAFCAKHPQ